MGLADGVEEQGSGPLPLTFPTSGPSRSPTPLLFISPFELGDMRLVFASLTPQPGHTAIRPLPGAKAVRPLPAKYFTGTHFLDRFAGFSHSTGAFGSDLGNHEVVGY